MRVLVVDDEPSVVAVCEALRARLHGTPRRAPVAALDRPALLDADRPAVVVLGPAATAREDAADVIGALAARVPVVIVGERDCAAAAVAALKAGAADYLTLGTPDLADRILAVAGSAEPASPDEPA